MMTRYFFMLLIICLLTGGCASTQELSNDPSDPWEGFNRGVYSFNDALDRAVLKPAARGYRAVSPEFVEIGVSNFFSNIGDVGVAFNNTLQFKFLDAATDVGRIIVNSTIGLLGFIDVASHMGLRKHEEDFGQTLGYWGIGTGPYVVLPLFGPSNLRDGPGKVVDSFMWPPSWADIKSSEYNGLFAVNLINTRAELLKVEEKVEEISRDRYVFIRDAYLDRREFLVNDGEISTDDDLYQDLEDE